MDTIITARELGKTYGSVTAVDGISFDVYRGESFGILGPNGAGKTTTIRMMFGFSPMSTGNLSVFDLDVRSRIRDIKYRLGVCQQDDTLDPDLTVMQNLIIFARYFDIPRKQAEPRAEELLRFISLDHRKNARVEELSGGMRRRLMLARALINRPTMLILDEPTTGLDPQARQQIWSRLEQLKSEGLTILLTTHYMEEAYRLCDRIIIMDHGKILVEGKPQELVERYVGREVLEVLFPSDELREYVRQRELPYEDLGTRLVIHGQDGTDLYRTISEQFCTAGCNLRMAGLEDVFLKLTGRGLRE